MILSRLLSLIFRFAEFVCAAVVLGVDGFLLHQYRHTHQGPLGREIYVEVIAGISLVAALIWMIPTTSAILHYPFDFLMVGAWFAAFGILVQHIHSIGCGSAFHWAGLANGSYCSTWKATEAFSFIAGCFWLASALLGIYVFHKLERRTAAAPPRRRRWGRRSYV